MIAKRLPPARPGKGGAARYVSGKMPQNAKNSHRSEVSNAKQTSPTLGNGLTSMNGAQTEEQRIAAMFKMGADQWAQQQQEMAKLVPHVPWHFRCIEFWMLTHHSDSATPVHRSGPNKSKPASVPDHPPPPGYICYRCGEKGHWIQVCPTNDDPAYENRPRVKRTTGIPRSFLKTIERPSAAVNDGTMDDTKQLAGVMVNAEGEWVIAEPDKAAWDQYQAKAKSSAAAQEAAKQGSKELQDRGLECSIDKHLFIDPTKTPCCHTTYCHDCINNALLESDLRCPKCSEEVLIENLEPDKEMIAKIRSYEEEKASTQVKRERSMSPSGAGQRKGTNSPSPNDLIISPQKDSMTGSNPRKRSAESELVNDHKATGPTEHAEQQVRLDHIKSESQNPRQFTASNMPANQQTPFSSGSYLMPQGMNAMAMPSMNNFMPMAMSMAPSMGMNPAFQNPMMMPNAFMGNEWVNMWSGGFPSQPLNNQGGGPQDYNLMHTHGMNGMNMSGMGVNGRGIHGQGRGPFANQQRTTFSSPSTNDEDSAYFRKPVNPHRHQARRNVQRPTDYHEI